MHARKTRVGAYDIDEDGIPLVVMITILLVMIVDANLVGNY